MRKVEIKHWFNNAYEYDDDEEYKFSGVTITLDGKKIFNQSASESLSECPEDARFYRDLNDPADVITLVQKLLEGNQEYEVSVLHEKGD